MSGSGAGPAAMTTGPGFFDRPYPADSRRVDGHPDVSGFPGEGDSTLVDAYLAAAGEIDGFGTNTPVYVRFEAAIDVERLPDAAASMRLDSPILLVDVDRESAHRGERTPLAFEWTATETSYQPANLLAAAPVFGFPLRPSTTYALVIRDTLAAPSGQAWGTGVSEELAPVQETLLGLGIAPEEVALAVTFTTQDPHWEMERIARAIHEELGIPAIDQELTLREERGSYDLYWGTVAVPVWQHGQRPYRTEGGAFAFDEHGDPTIAFWERVKFALTIPTGEEPADGWPVVLYSHGTGGDFRTFCQTGDPDEEASVMAREGVAMIGISQPLHADRATEDTDPSLDSFNYMNPYAGRTNFRQGALDQVYLAEVLTRATPTFTAEDRSVRLDPDRVAFFGHSQGGLVGAIAVPFFSDRVRAAGMSGTGGGLSMTLVLRKDPIDIAGLMESLLDFDEGETLTTFHPVTALVQTLSEATDPLNYSPYWYAEDPGWGGRPVPALLTEGLLDAATPSVTTEALAAAAHMPIVGDPATDPEALDLRDLSPDGLPTADNADDWNGDAITAGLGQFPDQDHYAIYYDRDARQLYRDFLVSALDGAPRLEE